MSNRKPERANGLLRSAVTATLFAGAVGMTATSAGPLAGGQPDLRGPTEGDMVQRIEDARQMRSYLTNRIIVKYREQNLAGMSGKAALDAANRGLSKMSADLGVSMKHVRVVATGAQVAKVETRGADVEALARRISERADVEYAEVDRLWQPLYTPNDTNYSSQWHYFESTAGMRVPGAWDTTEGSGTVVAVLDTGYRPHADLVDNILQGYDMISDEFVANDGDGRDTDARDPGDWTKAGECGNGKPERDRDSSWHGTHVAGTVAAVTNNGSDVAGVAGQAGVVPVRVLGKCGGLTSDIADGIIWASGGSVSGATSNANPADVINMSLGGGGSCPSTTQSAINTARNNGSTVVVAAGNSNDDASNYTPASCNGVVTVAATDRNGDRAYYSNYGSVVDLAAPGGDIRNSSSNGILSTYNNGSTTPGSDSLAWLQGTSMASPHVAGLAALVKSVDSSLSPDEVESLLKNNTRAFPGSCSGCGTGLADADATVAAASGGGGGGGSDTELSNGVAETDLSGAEGDELHFYMNVPGDASDLSFSISGGSGDADLYVKFGSKPTTSDYDCRPWKNGNNETCDISTVQEGTYYVMVHGYSSFSGVDLVGSYTEGSDDGGTTSCPSGYETFTGTLSDGGSAYEPDGSYYYSGSGTHNGDLHGASGTDFDLRLQKWNGSSWSTVDSSTSADSEESISYNGSSGYYVWKVESYSGSGDYLFCLDRP